MRSTIIQFDPLAVTSQADQSPHLRRSVGRLHVSQVYGDLDPNRRRYSSDRMGQVQLDSYRSVGFLWEHILSEAIVAALVDGEGWARPGEIELDGIIGSPDAFDMTDCSIVECKATYRSMRKMGDRAEGLRDEFWVWAVQMKAYCQMIGASKSKLYTLFVNGDYKSYEPAFRAWELEWTAQELTENWRMIIQHARSNKWL